jgi:LmbE family N-acetylglucosaminyl deacetylase
MNILVLAPHADDETLGCGGVIARLAAEGHRVTVAVVTGPGEGEHPHVPQPLFDQIREELTEAGRILGVAEIVYGRVPTTLAADMERRALNAEVKRLIEGARPEILFAPFALDLHSDHREIFHAASIAWRPHLDLGRSIREVYCYEVPTETHLNFPYVEQGFIPNSWFDISDHLETKLRAFAAFKSQAQEPPMPRSPEALRALATWRGSQIGVRAAEAFVLVRSLR